MDALLPEVHVGRVVVGAAARLVVDHHGVAGRAVGFFDEMAADGGVDRVEPVVLGDEELEAGGLGGGDGAFGVLKADGEGFFDHHVLAGGQGFVDELGVEHDGGYDDDGVAVVLVEGRGQGGVGGVGSEVSKVEALGHEVVVDVDEGDGFEVLGPGHDAEMGAGAVPGADVDGADGHGSRLCRVSGSLSAGRSAAASGWRAEFCWVLATAGREPPIEGFPAGGREIWRIFWGWRNCRDAVAVGFGSCRPDHF